MGEVFGGVVTRGSAGHGDRRLTLARDAMGLGHVGKVEKESTKSSIERADRRTGCGEKVERTHHTSKL